MTVPVVQVRPMRVSVHQGLVVMPVRVPGGGRQIGVLVIVVAIVVAMGVLVIEGLVRMRVCVTLDHEQRDAGDEERTRNELHGRQWFAQRQDR